MMTMNTGYSIHHRDRIGARDGGVYEPVVGKQKRVIRICSLTIIFGQKAAEARLKLYIVRKSVSNTSQRL